MQNRIVFDKKFKLKIGAAIFWLVFTGALILWWMSFALDLLQQVQVGVGQHQRMLFWEGSTLFIFLCAGGLTLIYFIFQEKRQSDSLREFFAAYSHEVKTALASLRLQVESLAEDLKDSGSQNLLHRLMSDASRLAVTVENSLFVGNELSIAYDFKQKIKWDELKQEIQLSWPQLNIFLDIAEDEVFSTDRRALISILHNLAHNSVHHGQASEVRISGKIDVKGQIFILTVSDNGKGFVGDRKLLSVRRVYRPTDTSGSGLGLYIVRQIVHKLKGYGPSFPETKNGFSVQLEFSL